MTLAVFLDRDGVINRAIVRAGRPYPPGSMAEFEVLPGVAKAISHMKQAGYLIIVVTNQPDVATGVQRREVVDAMHDLLLDTLDIDEVRVCFHVDEDGCACRKPGPGMLLDAMRAWGIDMERSYMVGDRWRDIEAGKAAGCRTILVSRSYDERQPEEPDETVDSLPEASELILTGAMNNLKTESRS